MLILLNFLRLFLCRSARAAVIARTSKSNFNCCEVLDAYFSSRDNLPGTTMKDEPLKADPMTTAAISNSLREMALISFPVIADWMLLHNFTFTTLLDGSVAWAIWRDMQPLM